MCTLAKASNVLLTASGLAKFFRLYNPCSYTIG